MKISDRDKFDDNELDCNLIEAGAMKDLIDFDKVDAPIDLSIRIDLVTDSDVNVLQSRKIHFKGSSCDERLNELRTYINYRLIQYLLSTCYLCKTITKVDIKFEVFHKRVHRKQFPLSLSYGIIIHKSQGTCKNAMMDLGTSVFSDDQAYVDLSRVNTLEDLHLTNFNPTSVKANSGTIVEYNREKYDLCNDDHVSCYANRTQQDDSEFFTVLMSIYSEINDVLKFELKHVTSCSNTKCNYNVTTLKKNCLLILPIQSTLKRKKLEFSKWKTINGNCNECKDTVLKKKTVIESALSVLVIAQLIHFSKRCF
ncbi:PIF1 helicase, partial [Acromyrmex heyeri]